MPTVCSPKKGKILNFKAMTKTWAQGLVKEISDPKNILISSSDAVVINDRYPKARQHFLVLPKADIPTIFNLRREHLPLLEELHLLALNVVEVKRLRWENFKIGFHAQPSMQRLHLHVISKDFVSDALKTKKHWNSFNTPLFLRYEDAYAQLETEGSIKRLDAAKLKELSAAELVCNQCRLVAKNMPHLKEHLLKHSQEAAT